MAADPTIDSRWRFTVDEYELIGRAGVLGEARTELLDGEIFAMSPIGARHASMVERITGRLYRTTGEDVSIRVQSPIRLLPRSEPEPDIVVSRARRDFYASAHPTAEDTLFVIEVSDSTLAFDRGVKIPIYAEQGIAEVWIVEVKAEVVHVHTDPNPKARCYRTVRSVQIGEVLVPTTIEAVRIPVADIF